MTPRARSTRVGTWLLVLTVTLLVLTASGPAPPPAAPERWGDWLATTPPVDAAFSLGRLAALGAGWYLAAITALGMGVRLIRAPRWVAAADRLTLPPLRRVLAQVGVATVGLTGGVAPFGGATAAVAATQPYVDPATPDADLAEGTITMRRLPPGTSPPSSPSVVPSAPEVPPVTDAPVAAQPSSWTVAPGESFWSIADQVLARAWGRSPADEEVVPYWHTLIDSNRPELADPSNPDLLYPGQTFTVPAP